jgi:hypothetical protein
LPALILPQFRCCCRADAAHSRISGSMGTLIGADLTSLDKVAGLGAPVASIGGAGISTGFSSPAFSPLLAGLLHIPEPADGATAGKRCGRRRRHLSKWRPCACREYLLLRFSDQIRIRTHLCYGMIISHTLCCRGFFNGVPHFVQGICGNKFQTPLHGRAASRSGANNVIWAGPAIIGGVLLRVSFPPLPRLRRYLRHHAGRVVRRFSCRVTSGGAQRPASMSIACWSGARIVAFLIFGLSGGADNQEGKDMKLEDMGFVAAADTPGQIERLRQLPPPHSVTPRRQAPLLSMPMIIAMRVRRR